jgi:hypothetical protein
MWVFLTGYPIMVDVMVGSGSQELIAKFGPIISTEALCTCGSFMAPIGSLFLRRYHSISGIQ